jgi:putative membrane protein
MNRRNIIIGIVVAVVVLLVVGLLVGVGLWGAAHYAYGPHIMRPYARFPMMGYRFGGGILILLFWVAIVGGGALLIAGLVWLFRRNQVPGGSQEAMLAEPKETPLEILRRRYAQGEIDREEFLRMKETLTS